jgi:hypothetical protein
MIDKIKNNLTALIATIGLIGTIGTGFVKYGEIMNKIDAVEPAKIAQSFEDQNNKIAEQNKFLNEKISEQKSTIEKQITSIMINEKEIELLKAQIKELKIKSGNPLSN